MKKIIMMLLVLGSMFMGATHVGETQVEQITYGKTNLMWEGLTHAYDTLDVWVDTTEFEMEIIAQVVSFDGEYFTAVNVNNAHDVVEVSAEEFDGVTGDWVEIIFEDDDVASVTVVDMFEHVTGEAM